MKALSTRLAFCVTLLFPAVALAQTGKISGRVTDTETGQPLPGVNVVIEGTTQGSTADVDGYYTILNVTPGVYSVRASFVGFTPLIIEDVRVNIDLTTELDFALREETVGLDEVVVTASEPVVRRDISANVANLSAEDIENLPVASVSEVIGLQAGIEPGLSVRGSAQDQIGFLVDGMSMRDGRDNAPFTGISYTSVSEVQVQTGGFSAEYGNVRSGLVNVVTKEGPRDRYTVDFLARYAPPQRRNFGMDPDDPNSYFMRPFLDPEVADVGTIGAGSPWDEYTRRQYPAWKGWDQVIAEWNNDAEANNDLTREQFEDLFWWYRRKDLEVNHPDYEVDGTIGGPVPGISGMLGDLRFVASYRKTQAAYFIPQVRDLYGDQTARLKLTTDLAQGMKLTLQGMYAEQHGLNATQEGGPDMFQGEMPRYPWENRNSLMTTSIVGGNTTTGRIWANHNWNPMDVTRNMISADFTHTLTASTFYKVRLQRMFSHYNTYLDEADRRDPTNIIHQIGELPLDSTPFGYWPQNDTDPTGLYMGGHWSKSRDSSKIALWTTNLDITSQVSQFAQLKGGLEFVFGNYDVNHRQVNEYFKADLSPVYVWRRNPTQGAAYLQSKLEFQSIVANIGVRADYWHAGGEWYAYDPYDRALSALFGKDMLDEELETEPTERLVALSPRLGISFPITTESKFFFNYGHFRQMNNPHDLFLVREVVTGAVDRMGDPNAPLPRTIAYELGYEHSLFDRYLVRATGYYKALGDQSRNVRYVNLDETVDYQRAEPLNYADIRGVELTLRKNVGRYFRGFVNLTYMSVKRGNFGFDTIFENQVRQREYERTSRAHYQSKPVPEPYARVNLEFLAPRDFGPGELGSLLLGNWRANLLGEWRAGQVFTWTGDVDIEGLSNNVQWADYYNLDLRLSKAFDTGLGTTQLFIDVNNLLNLRHLNRYGNFFSEDGRDWDHYMMSLHLPEDAFEGHDPNYLYVPGNDRPGAYSKPGVEFQPIEAVVSVEEIATPHERPLYYEVGSGRYMDWRDGQWVEADEDYVDEVLDTKAYIDMPNIDFLNFLNPRTVRFGMRVSL